MLDKEQVVNEIRKVVANFVGIKPEEVKLEENLRVEYGLDSIESSELIMEMEDKYGLKISFEEAKLIGSTQDAIDYVLSHSK